MTIWKEEIKEKKIEEEFPVKSVEIYSKHKRLIVEINFTDSTYTIISSRIPNFSEGESLCFTPTNDNTL
jgi:predicted aconitase